MDAQIAKTLQDFVGALATEFIGRKELLNDLKTAIQNAAPGPQVLMLIGDGGMGKTRLLRAVHEWAAEQPTLLIGKELIDVYHYAYHTPIGLADRIVEILPREVQGEFEHYKKLRKEMDVLRSGGIASTDQVQEALNEFINALSWITKKNHLVLLIDTAERLVYFKEHRAACWPWLLELLRSTKNITLILAGRKAAEPLAEELKAQVLSVKQFDVEQFREEDSLEYFAAAARAARNANATQVAERIDAINPNLRRQAHEQAKGQPIRLALLVALYSVGAPPPLDAFDQTLIAKLMETPILGQTVDALGLLPRGVSPQLLAEVLEISLEEAKERFEMVKGLAFVKPNHFGDEELLFLHDELYSMLQTANQNNRIHAVTIWREAVDYYRRQLEKLSERLNKAYAPIEGAEFEDDEQKTILLNAREHAREATQLMSWQQMLIADRIFYRFRVDFNGGFRYYYRYAQEAISANDLQLYWQVQAEASIALNEAHVPLTSTERDLLAGALHQTSMIEQRIAGNLTAILQSAEALRRDHPARFGLRNLGGWADSLKVFEALIRVYRADKDDWEKARRALDVIIRELNKIKRPETSEELEADALRWHRLATLAMAYRARGYLNSQQEHLNQSQDDYYQAIELYRDLKIEAEHARILNDRAYVLAKLGKTDDALTLVNDALNLRLKIGRRSPVALSLNTLGIINRQKGDYNGALTMSWRALLLARFLGDLRIQGLALTALAEARRRQVSVDPNMLFGARQRHLRQAEAWARQALENFEATNELSRQVRAWIEIGCAQRDQIRYLKDERPQTGQEVAIETEMQKLREDSEKALRQAAALARELSIYDRLDALVNLAWLGYYHNDESLIGQMERLVLQETPPAYQWFSETDSERISITKAQEVGIWQQLGKLYMLRGFWKLRSFNPNQVPNNDLLAIESAAYEHALGLQYSALYSENFPPLLMARQQMYELYKKFNRAELIAAARGTLRFEQRFKKLLSGKSAMRQFLENFALWRQPPPG